MPLVGSCHHREVGAGGEGQACLLVGERVDVLMVGAEQQVPEDGAALADRHVLVQLRRLAGAHRVHQDLQGKTKHGDTTVQVSRRHASRGPGVGQTRGAWA